MPTPTAATHGYLHPTMTPSAPPAPPPRKFRAVWLGLLVIVVGLAAWGWVERHRLMAWHFSRGLATASSEQCGWYVERLAPLGEEAVTPLVRRLREPEETAKVNSGWAMAELAGRWGLDDPAAQALSREICEALPDLDDAGRREGCNVLRALLLVAKNDAIPDWLTRDLCRALPQTARDSGEESRPAAVELAAQLVHRACPTAPDVLSACKSLVDAGLRDTRGGCRASAVRLAIAPGVELHDRIATLLTSPAQDPSAEVRMTALLALGSQEDLLPTDEVLPYLHDADGDVRAVAEQALKSRGLLASHVQLARQMTDPQPLVRARVPALVFDFPDLDTRLWLERLSRDRSPSVRAAVLRAAGETKEWRLTDRMREMAAGDPSPTIRQIARYYLQEQLSRPND